MVEKKQNAATRAKEKYNAAHYDQVKFVVKKGGRDTIDAAAEQAGMSRNAYILKAIKEKMERDGFDGYLDFAAEEG
ncbi:transcriptional regulator [Paenibacillus oleatilyticus]|uniref:transcriptional regulator n=1 Tax=Paenibacillus oleatilyticus TaxID=2594886 RepID=UPI001C1FEC0E|nr:transcriptional regulator [Paenibacillus oleatilyticus]MBU7318434.1 transcriptional regulator [Paenibacillus oleatilyticus]